MKLQRCFRDDPYQVNKHKFVKLDVVRDYETGGKTIDKMLHEYITDYNRYELKGINTTSFIYHVENIYKTGQLTFVGERYKTM